MATAPADPVFGKVVAVTGGARGIGLATARALVRAGASVAVGDLDGDLAAEEAEALGGRAFGMALDVTDRASFAAFLDTAQQRLGGLDVLVNNAGIMPLGRLVEESDEVTRRILDINVAGVLLGTKLAIERMAPTGRGHIINIASAVGRLAVPNAVTYSASKYAVIGATEATRWEVEQSGLDVSCILPMVVSTELTTGLPAMKGQRQLDPDEIAAAVLKRIRRPRFETWVPASGQVFHKVLSVLPRRWAEAVVRRSGGNDVLANADAGARRGYEARARGPEQAAPATRNGRAPAGGQALRSASPAGASRTGTTCGPTAPGWWR